MLKLECPSFLPAILPAFLAFCTSTCEMPKWANIMARCPKLRPQKQKKICRRIINLRNQNAAIPAQYQASVFLAPRKLSNSQCISSPSSQRFFIPSILRSAVSSLIRSAGLEEVTLGRESGGPVILQVATSVFYADWGAKSVTIFDRVDGGVRINHEGEAVCRVLVGEVG
jgi:hypothetical protein